MPSRIFDRCHYRDCKNIRSDEIKLFHFPTKNDPRHEIWITNSGNGHYLRKWSASTIRSAGLCYEHFFPEAFWNNTRKKLRLKQNPIPYAPPEQKGMVNLRNIGQNEKDTETRMEEENPKIEIEIEIKEEKFENEIKEDTEVMMEDENRNIAENKGEEQETAKETDYKLEKVAGTLSDSFYNEECELRLDKAKVLKTYPGAVKGKQRISCFNKETDVMDFSKIEPPTHSKSSDTQKDSTITAYINAENITKSLTKKYKKLQNDDEKVKMKMRKKIMLLQQQIKTVRAQRRREIAALTKKKFNINEFLDAHDFSNPLSRAIVTLQFRKKKIPFTKDELNLAKKMYQYSPAMYRYWRKLGIKLPTPSLIRKVLAKENLSGTEPNVKVKGRNIDETEIVLNTMKKEASLDFRLATISTSFC